MADPVELEPAHIDLQQKMLAVFHATDSSPDALRQLKRVARAARAAFVNGYAQNKWLPEIDQYLAGAAADKLACPFCAPWLLGALKLPEAPALVAVILTAVWEPPAREWTGEPWLDGIGTPQCQKLVLRDRTDPVRFPRSSIGLTMDELEPRLRELRNRFGLSTAHVPSMIRYADDPTIIGENDWIARRRSCRVLHDWLTRLEDDVDERSWSIWQCMDDYTKCGDTTEYRGQFTPRWRAEDIRRLVVLAEVLIRRGLNLCVDQRTGITASMLRHRVPGVAGFERAKDLAEAWIWLDASAGTDAHARIPVVNISSVDLAQFHSRLGADGQLWLREYALAAAERDVELASQGDPQGLPARLRWPV
ncbi:hypothetical protein TVH25_11865 [Rhodococcus sp. 7Tela_A2]|uniref:hypothetical protein n=1 Tax=Rhodococcus sp. 7Tela_A2 TaxID=3093744 RepID=UPI003BB7CE05